MPVISASVPSDPDLAKLNFCRGGGSIAAVGQQPSSDPADYDATSLAIRGCNRLRCSACGAMVRYAANLPFKKWPTPADLVASYELPVLAPSPLLSSATSRLYL